MGRWYILGGGQICVLAAGVQSTDCSIRPAQRMTRPTSVRSGTRSVTAYHLRSPSPALATAPVLRVSPPCVPSLDSVISNCRDLASI